MTKHLSFLLAEAACTQAEGAPMAWWQALLMTTGCLTLAVAIVVVVVLLGGPRR